MVYPHARTTLCFVRRNGSSQGGDAGGTARAVAFAAVRFRFSFVFPVSPLLLACLAGGTARATGFAAVRRFSFVFPFSPLFLASHLVTRVVISSVGINYMPVVEQLQVVVRYDTKACSSFVCS